jgi:hypothetical protein
MTYWRMQLHPADPHHAIQRTTESLNAGFIGLDFDTSVGDLSTLVPDDLPLRQRDYWAFFDEMAIDDVVLIIAHHFPFALVKVNGRYNYIRKTTPKLGIWFRHFRQVKDVRYFADYNKNALSWPRLIMTDTISPLRDVHSASYNLIVEWENS